jgi:hypothetical protein
MAKIRKEEQFGCQIMQFIADIFSKSIRIALLLKGHALRHALSHCRLSNEAQSQPK